MSAARIVHDTTYCRIVSRDSPRTIITFSAVNVPAGKFAGSHALENADCNVVFLNCHNDSWYLEGVPGLGDCPESSVKALLALLTGFGLTDDRRVVWGGSMGGYGAVVYGALMGAEVIVASGAVLRLFAPGSLSEKFLKISKKPGELRVPDVRQLVENARGRFFLYAGEFCYPDLAAALTLIDLPNVSVTTLEDFGHWLPTYLDGRYGLLRFLLHHLDEGRVFPFEDGEVGRLKEWMDHWNLLDQAALGWTETHRDELLEQVAGTTDAVWKMHCHHALSLGASQSGFHQRAVLQAQKALKACPGSRHAALRLVWSLRKSGAPTAEWLEVATAIRDLNRPHVFHPAPELLQAMAQAFADTCRIREGVGFLRNQMLNADTTPATGEWFQELIGKLSGSRTWGVSFSPEAAAELPAAMLDKTLLHVIDGKSTIAGVMLFPAGWGSPVTFKARNLAILSSHSLLASVGVGKLHPENPQAARARFKMTLQFEDMDFATIDACGPDGRRLPLITFERMPQAED